MKIINNSIYWGIIYVTKDKYEDDFLVTRNVPHLIRRINLIFTSIYVYIKRDMVSLNALSYIIPREGLDFTLSYYDDKIKLDMKLERELVRAHGGLMSECDISVTRIHNREYINPYNKISIEGLSLNDYFTNEASKSKSLRSKLFKFDLSIRNMYDIVFKNKNLNFYSACKTLKHHEIL